MTSNDEDGTAENGVPCATIVAPAWALPWIICRVLERDSANTPGNYYRKMSLLAASNEVVRNKLLPSINVVWQYFLYCYLMHFIGLFYSIFKMRCFHGLSQRCRHHQRFNKWILFRAQQWQSLRSRIPQVACPLSSTECSGVCLATAGLTGSMTLRTVSHEHHEPLLLKKCRTVDTHHENMNERLLWCWICLEVIHVWILI